MRAAGGLEADAAFWSSWLATRATVQRCAAAMQRPLAEAPDAAPAAEAQARFLDFGIEVDDQGGASFTRAAEAEVAQTGWILEDEARMTTPRDPGVGPTHRLLGRILRRIAQLRAARRWAHADTDQRECRASAGGPGTGSVWTAPPDGDLMPDAHWRVTTQTRLGALRLPGNLKCCLEAPNGKQCGAQIDTRGHHAQLCKKGPARLRSHRATLMKLAGCLRQAGAHLDAERAIPELFEWYPESTSGGGIKWLCHEAVVDVAAWWPGALGTALYDITIRCPHAARYATTSSPQDRAAGDKHRRYGPSVSAMAFSSYGRLGTDGITALAAATTAAQWATEDYTASRGRMAKWRLQLERTLLHAQADVTLLALGAGGLAGWQRHAGTRLGRTQAASAQGMRTQLGEEKLTQITATRLEALQSTQHARDLSDEVEWEAAMALHGLDLSVIGLCEAAPPAS